MSNAALIACLQRIESDSEAYRDGPVSPESRDALKQSLVEGYPVLAAQKGADPIVERAMPRIMTTCRSIILALDSGIMKFVSEPRSRRMARESCAELSLLVGGLMPYLTAMEKAGS